jgi:hypothetical protein
VQGTAQARLFVTPNRKNGAHERVLMYDLQLRTRRSLFSVFIRALSHAHDEISIISLTVSELQELLESSASCRGSLALPCRGRYSRAPIK